MGKVIENGGGRKKAIATYGLTKYYGMSRERSCGDRQYHEKKSGAVRGIEGVDLSVGEGDFFGFIGPNGAGKSTTIRILLGLISPTEGRAEIFGRGIQEEKMELLARIGYLPSEPYVYRGMRVRDVLDLSARLRRKDCAAEARKLCSRLELDMSRKVDELSLGNRKKVGIVCAMQHRPELYILDEPTSGLDPLMQREFYSLLKERNQEGATVFLSSHILSEVQRYCRHAAVIRAGKVLACDSVEKLGHTDAKRVTLRCAGDMSAREQAERLGMFLRQSAARTGAWGGAGNSAAGAEDWEKTGSNDGGMEDRGKTGNNGAGMEDRGKTGNNGVGTEAQGKAGGADVGTGVRGGIKNMDIQGDVVSFLYSGEASLLLKALSELSPADVTITEPDLEEVFMHYFREQ